MTDGVLKLLAGVTIDMSLVLPVWQKLPKKGDSLHCCHKTGPGSGMHGMQMSARPYSIYSLYKLRALPSFVTRLARLRI